jgi:hypothetical protein
VAIRSRAGSEVWEWFMNRAFVKIERFLTAPAEKQIRLNLQEFLLS